jgi:hypothetical protein
MQTEKTNFVVRRPLLRNHMLSHLIIDTVIMPVMIMQRERMAQSDHLFILVSKQELQTEEFHLLRRNTGVHRNETVELLPPHLEGPR